MYLQVPEIEQLSIEKDRPKNIIKPRVQVLRFELDFHYPSQEKNHTMMSKLYGKLVKIFLCIVDFTDLLSPHIFKSPR